MSRHWKDALGDEWEVEIVPEDAEHPDTGEPLPFALVRFEAEDRSMEIFARGEMAESVEDVDDDLLELAMEAAKDGRGFLFVDARGHAWWVKGPGEDDVDTVDHPITFDNGVDELRHPGPLPAPALDLADDELEELLDRLRGVAA